MLNAPSKQEIGLVRRIAGAMLRRLPRDVEFEELVNDGLFGLHTAGQRFDPRRGVPFDSFATSWIRGAMLDGLRRRDWLSRRFRVRKLPAPQKQRLNEFTMRSSQHEPTDRDALPRLLVMLPRRQRLVLLLYYLEQMSMEEVAAVLSITVSRVSQLRAAAIGTLRQHIDEMENKGPAVGERPRGL